MVKILRKIISDHPTSKGCFMEVKQYKEKELPKRVKKFDIIGIKFKSSNGIQIDCYVKPDELLELGELFISAYNNYSKDKLKKEGKR